MKFTAKEYKELVKLYPNIRIPFMDKAEYYLELLSRTMLIQPHLDLMQDCMEKHGNIESYKMSTFDKAIKYFKENEILEKFSNAPYSEYQSQYPKQFNNWKEDKIYISLDVNEANWSIFKLTLDEHVPGDYYELKLMKWSEFLKARFNAHPFIANSKSFRQFILGNLNPSRQQTFQKRYMGKIAEKCAVYNDKIVMLSADEILFEFPDMTLPLLDRHMEGFRIIMETSKLPMKLKAYCVKRVSNYGDSVLIKEDVISGDRELFAVNGNRYFIHYRKLILNEEPQENDLYFEPEPKKLAKWVL